MEELKLWSSDEEQLRFQREVPIAHVTAELFCVWFDDLQMEKTINEKWFREVFSGDEISAVERFHRVFNQSSVPAYEVLIADFILTPEWATISEAAREALSCFPAEEIPHSF